MSARLIPSAVALRLHHARHSDSIQRLSGPGGEGMARIVVQRVHATMASHASVTLTLDGVKHGRIKSGATLSIDVAEGAYQLRAHQQWFTSNALPIVLRHPDDEVRVELTTSQDPDDPADMGFLRSLVHPRSAFTLRHKD